MGWSVKGKVPPVDLLLRKGNPGYNDAAAEVAVFPRRTENGWPIARTQYTRFYLTPDNGLQTDVSSPSEKVVSYKAPGNVDDPQFVTFTTAPFEKETEITGHIVAHLNVSCSAIAAGANPPSDIDLFVSLRHFDDQGKEIFYTGTMGDPVPVVKGWLRVSLRKVDEEDPRHRTYLPYRAYRKSDVQGVQPGKVYPVDIELWPTNVVVGKGNTLALEVSSGDTQGTGIFRHYDADDRSVFCSCVREIRWLC